MAADPRLPKLAVLIDADNLSPRIAAGLFKTIARLGEARVRRAYGDFSGQRLKSWVEILPTYAIDVHQQFAYTPGKNASDIALVIDAMDLLHSGRFDGFCLVTSDSDFTRLASRLREQGADVYGFGERKAPESLRQACRRFTYIEDLLPAASPPATIVVPSPQPKAQAPQAKPTQPVRSPGAAIAILHEAVALSDADDGWVRLATVGSHLMKIVDGFDPRSYGYRKLSDLVRGTEAFDVDASNNLGIRIRPRATVQPPAADPATPRQIPVSDQAPSYPQNLTGWSDKDPA